jgi:hypothetical protein
VTIEQIIQERQISEILHFTTSDGLTGILHERQVKARAFLKDDETLAFILKLNTQKNYDPDWKQFVNLSISRINHSLFGYSKHWHPDARWRILAFDPVILTHNGVHFVTTNNAYWQHLVRGTGALALARLFDPEVKGIYDNRIGRTEHMPTFWTTDVQAEVLYPKAVPTTFLRTIYVRTPAEADSVAGKIATLQHADVSIVVCPEKFVK